MAEKDIVQPNPLAPRIEQSPSRSESAREEVAGVRTRKILDGLTAALADHGYDDTRITYIVGLAGVPRPTFYELFESKDQCFAVAYSEGVERLAAAIEEAIPAKADWPEQVSAGLAAGLEFLAASPALAHLLLVEALAASRPVRLEHERSLQRLAVALRPPAQAADVPEEAAWLLAGGLTSLLAGRVLAGEAERLPEAHVLLLDYVLASSPPATGHPARDWRA